MSSFQVREAMLEDTHAVCELARMQIGVWQRMDTNGQVYDVPYEQLTIYERWLHGGPWMTLETAVLQLSHLRQGAGLALVAKDDAHIVGYAEFFIGKEAKPYRHHIHMGTMMIHPAFVDKGVDEALFTWVMDWARRKGIEVITANCAAHDKDRIAFFEHYRLKQLESVHRMVIPTKTGQVFYRALDHDKPDHDQINGWYLHIGRLGSARFQWETLWPRIWDAVPEIAGRRVHRLNFNAAGNDAFVLIREQLYRKRQADVFCWTPKPPTSQLITAIRDWAHHEGYRRLTLAVVESSIKTLGIDAESDGYIEYVYGKEL